MFEEGSHILFCPDDTVRQFTITKGKTASIEDAIKALQSKDIETPILPYGTIVLKKKVNQSIYFVQRPPEKQVLSHNGKFYTIAIPWRVFALVFTGELVVNYYLRFAMDQIHNFSDPLYIVPLPNIGLDGNMCMGVGLMGEVGKSGPISEIVSKIIIWVNKSAHNDHLKGGINSLPAEMMEGKDSIRGPADTFSYWEEWTKNAGKAWRGITDLTWVETETFGAMVRKVK